MGLKRNRKKGHQTHKEEEAPNKVSKGPRILVAKRGSVGPVLPHLMNDILKMLAPNSVRTIKVLRNSRVKDLKEASGPLHISHAIIFTRTIKGLYMKLCTFPQGPTITFSIKNYTLQRDVLASQKRPPSVPPSYELTAPCLIMNNLQPHQGPRHLQLVASSLLQIFPKIIPSEASIKSIRRCCFVNYDETTEEFNMRHYVVKVTNVASAKLVTKLVNSKHIPDLHNYDKIEDALACGYASESEGEEESKVELKHMMDGSGRPRTAKDSIKLKDAGPRIAMKVHKVESGLLEGEVLYNRVKKLSPKEKQRLKELREIKRKEKLDRKQRQAANVARKKKQLEDHKDKCLEGMPEELRERAILNKKKRAEEEEEEEEEELSEREDEEEEEKEDIDYYREEVGEVPEGVSFSDRMKRRREKDTDTLEAKKRKLEEVENKKLEAKRAKAKERYKELDERKKKRPRSYGKRMVKQMKQKAKQRQAQKSSDKDKEDGGSKAGPKTVSKTGPKTVSKTSSGKK